MYRPSSATSRQLDPTLRLRRWPSLPPSRLTESPDTETLCASIIDLRSAATVSQVGSRQIPLYIGTGGPKGSPPLPGSFHAIGPEVATRNQACRVRSSCDGVASGVNKNAASLSTGGVSRSSR
jgi:hypothetical protein